MRKKDTERTSAISLRSPRSRTKFNDVNSLKNIPNETLTSVNYPENCQRQLKELHIFFFVPGSNSFCFQLLRNYMLYRNQIVAGHFMWKTNKCLDLSCVIPGRTRVSNSFPAQPLLSRQQIYRRLSRTRFNPKYSPQRLVVTFQATSFPRTLRDLRFNLGTASVEASGCLPASDELTTDRNFPLPIHVSRHYDATNTLPTIKYFFKRTFKTTIYYVILPR